MITGKRVQQTDVNGNPIFPITHESCIKFDDGESLEDKIMRVAEVEGFASAAEASKNTAKSQADISIQKASEASTSASEALTYKSNALDSAEDAELSAQKAANNLLNGVGTHDGDAGSHTDIRNAAQQAENIARGRATAHVFDTLDAMTAWLAVPENLEGLVVGDNLYIRDTGVKDYWWDGTEAQELEAEAPDLTDYYTKTQVDSMLPIYIAQTEYDALVQSGTIVAGRIYYVG